MSCVCLCVCEGIALKGKPELSKVILLPCRVSPRGRRWFCWCKLLSYVETNSFRNLFFTCICLFFFKIVISLYIFSGLNISFQTHELRLLERIKAHENKHIGELFIYLFIFIYIHLFFKMDTVYMFF